MSAYADSSFVCSAFGADSNTRAAALWMRGFSRFPLLVSRLTILETENSLRNSVIIGDLTEEQFRAALHGIHRAMHEGIIERRQIAPHQWFPQAQRLSAHRACRKAIRALDILHVAAAKLLRTDDFLSFDDRQREFAAAEGLKVMP